MFSHADPSRTIQSMKSANSQLQETRNLLHNSMERITGIKAGVANTSDNLVGTNSMYWDYEHKLKKSRMYLVELKKKEAANARKIRMSFFFLVFTVIFVVIRRIIFPDIYRWSWFSSFNLSLLSLSESYWWKSVNIKYLKKAWILLYSLDLVFYLIRQYIIIGDKIYFLDCLNSETVKSENLLDIIFFKSQDKWNI